ncbi:MAG: metal-dependent hydrolase [Chloroflexota bacterium]
MLIGHFAVSTLLHRYLEVDLSATMIGGIFPDIVDKTLCQGLHITPSGRMYSHTLVSLVMSTLLIRKFTNDEKALGWGLGYFGHLIADTGGFVPLFYPFRKYHFFPSERSFTGNIWDSLFTPRWLEWALVLWAVLAMIQTKKKTR